MQGRSHVRRRESRKPPRTRGEDGIRAWFAEAKRDCTQVEDTQLCQMRLLPHKARQILSAGRSQIPEAMGEAAWAEWRGRLSALWTAAAGRHLTKRRWERLGNPSPLSLCLLNSIALQTVPLPLHPVCQPLSVGHAPSLPRWQEHSPAWAFCLQQ